MEAAVTSEFSGALKTGLLGIIVFTRSPGEYENIVIEELFN